MDTQFGKEFIEKQKQSLIREKQRLEAELKSRGKEKKSVPGDYKADYQDFGSDEESNAQEYAQTETDTAIVEQLDDELLKVNKAIDRIEIGTYGFDIETGKPIPKERLEANPSAEKGI